MDINGVEYKRQLLMSLYPRSAKWVNKVKNMSEAQVIAIFLKKRQEQKL